MEKRTLLALLISFAFLISYQAVLHKMYPDYFKRLDRQAAAKSQAGPKAVDPVMPANPGKAQPLDTQKDIAVRSEKLELDYSGVDGSLRRVSFPRFAQPETGKALVLFDRRESGAGPGSLYFVNGEAAPARVQSADAAGATATVSGLSEDGAIRFTQVTEWSGYSAKLRWTFENVSEQDQKLRYALNLGETLPTRNSIDGQYAETNFYEKRSEGSSHLRHIKESGAGKTVRSGPLEWIAVKDRHFAVIVAPPADGSWTGQVTGLGNHKASTRLISPEIIMAPRGHLEHEMVLYVGPVEYDELAPLKLDAIINFGKMDSISRLLVGVLELLHRGVRNYGLAIILLTIAINLLLFPLTRASMQSMKRMQALQPQMTRLREQYKNQPEKLNREMMELYKKHKVNPFGGCLPMLLQMPVFIALYVALSKSTALINSRFLWVNDLSAPDRVLLPLALPGIGREIHVLPLIMALGMALQQRFTQAQMPSQDPAMAQQQKIMSVMMPILFCFIFYTMPSGLVLYWLTNTVLMTAYQLSLKRSSA